jgi:hyperosmotically inducible protein
MSLQRIRGIAAAVITAVCVGCSASDAGITTAIKTELAADDEVKAYQIDVDTKEKIVTLTGTVDTARAKTRAAEIARLQKGVFQVIDNVTVTPAAPPPIPDAALTAAVKTKLLADTATSGLKINIDTLDGVVTLSGDVRSQTEKDVAVRLTRETTGVREVNDRLTVVARTKKKQE